MGGHALLRIVMCFKVALSSSPSHEDESIVFCHKRLIEHVKSSKGWRYGSVGQCLLSLLAGFAAQHCLGWQRSMVSVTEELNFK